MVRARDYDLEILAALQHPFQAAENEVHVEAAFMRFIDNHAFVASEPWVTLDLRQQQAIVITLTTVRSDVRSPKRTA